MKTLARWGDGIVGQTKPDAELSSKHSRLYMYKRNVILNGVRLQAGGIGGVWTEPAHRGEGHARDLMTQAIAFLTQKWKSDLGILFSLDNTLSFYQGLGWEYGAFPVTIQQPSGVVPLPKDITCFIYPINPVSSGPLVIEGLPW